MMCKRYRLSGRQGRYLILMCSKYSNIKKVRFDFHSLDSSFLLSQKQQRACSLIAHEAIHNVLGLLDTNFLMLKPFGQTLDDINSLGMQTYRIIFNLGFWKKLVYLLQSKMSLHLCMKFFDFRNYRLILRGFLSHEEKLNNKQVLDVWTVKAQVKGYLLDKKKAFTPFVNYHD